MKCLAAVATQRDCPSFGVFICENGGPGAYDTLKAALTAPDGPCPGASEALPVVASEILRAEKLTLAGAGAPVCIAEARENGGFAGGINAWMRPLMAEGGWRGAWVLNPDTWPQPDALAALVRYAEKRGKGMVQSQIMFPDRSDVASSRGLKWRKFRASVVGVDIFAPVSPPPDPDDVEQRIEAPTGVSFYVTRECVDRIGLMDESYFLYWEDFDWGIRAKAACGIGYAHDSVVPHVGGSSSGAVRKRSQRSPAAVYLKSRNQLYFVRQHHPRWYAWTVFVSFLRAGEFLAAGSATNLSPRLKVCPPACAASEDARRSPPSAPGDGRPASIVLEAVDLGQDEDRGQEPDERKYGDKERRPGLSDRRKQGREQEYRQE